VTDDTQYDWRRFLGTPRFIVEMPHTVSFLVNRQTFRGRAIVWLKERYDGLSDVPKDLRDASMAEMLRIADAIQHVFRPARMNYACYGNIVPQVHWHLVPRYTDDPDWNGPPTLQRPAAQLADAEYEAMVAQIRTALETDADR
jgi:diadenosine tetraphosphate (Ap4A) HIT family hydrolase